MYGTGIEQGTAITVFCCGCVCVMLCGMIHTLLEMVKTYNMKDISITMNKLEMGVDL